MTQRLSCPCGAYVLAESNFGSIYPVRNNELFFSYVDSVLADFVAKIADRNELVRVLKEFTYFYQTKCCSGEIFQCHECSNIMIAGRNGDGAMTYYSVGIPKPMHKDTADGSLNLRLNEP